MTNVQRCKQSHANLVAVICTFVKEGGFLKVEEEIREREGQHAVVSD